MSDLEPQLDELRRQIGALDDQIVRQLNSRAKLVVEIGRLKARSGVPVFAPDREREVLDRIRGCNAGPLSDRTLAAIYRELMSGSFVLERMFAWEGIGMALVEAADAYDLPVLMGTLSIAGVGILIAHLGVDLLNAWLDPRQRRSGTAEAY